jgi:hypothetical protein
MRRSGAVVLRLTGHRTCFHAKRHGGGADCICGSVRWDDLIRGSMEYDNAPDQANPCLWLIVRIPLHRVPRGEHRARRIAQRAPAVLDDSVVPHRRDLAPAGPLPDLLRHDLLAARTSGAAAMRDSCETIRSFTAFWTAKSANTSSQPAISISWDSRPMPLIMVPFLEIHPRSGTVSCLAGEVPLVAPRQRS